MVKRLGKAFRGHRAAGIILAVLFVSVILLIGFFHTEKTFKPNPNCPACNLQVSSLGTFEASPAVVPQIRLLECVEPVRMVLDGRLVSRDLVSRAPPRG